MAQFNLKNIENIFMADSAYGLLMYLARFPEKEDTTLFVLGQSVKDVAVTGPKIVYERKDAQKDPDYEFHKNKLKYQLDNLLNGKILPCYANARYPYAPDLLLGNYPFHVISDGASDPDMFPEYFKDERYTSCYSQPNLMGDIQHPKLHVFDLNKTLDEKTPQQLAYLAQVFNMPQEDLDLLKTRRVVLMTQPMSEDGIMSEEEKLYIYQNILTLYKPDEVVIKGHPREKTCYTDHFKNVPQIKNGIPMELLTALLRSNNRNHSNGVEYGVNTGTKSSVEKAQNGLVLAGFFVTSCLDATSPDEAHLFIKDWSELACAKAREIITSGGQKISYKAAAGFDMEETYGNREGLFRRVPDPNGLLYKTPETVNKHVKLSNSQNGKTRSE